jgi:TldD protein
MLHEAVGHGLEGDFNRKKTSAFAGLLGEMVASPNVTVVDDGTIDNRRGSITVDDEGTPSAYNVLIEKGRLVGYMQDRQNARLMGMNPTGNGRRQGYSHVPMPRMTNTYMLSGDKTPDEIIASVKKGIYAVSFGGGQVDITSGKFVFGCTEAYMIEDGKLGPAIKGAMLIGNGRDEARLDGGQRYQARHRHWQLRQGRPVGSCRRRPATSADGPGDSGRHANLNRCRQTRLSRSLPFPIGGQAAASTAT